MNRPSLRTMMLVPILFTMAIGFTGFAVYIDGVEYQNRLADIDDELFRASRRTGPLDAAPPGPPQNGPVDAASPDDEGAVPAPVQLVLSPSGDLLEFGTQENPFTPAALRALPQRAGTGQASTAFTVDDPRVRVLAAARRDGNISITALPLDDLDEAVSGLRRALIAAGLVIIVLQALVVWLLTTVTIRPVTRMTLTATKVADGALDTEVGPPSGAREVAALATDLDRMLVRLRNTIARSDASAAEAQQARDDMERFVADVSHEFRTPLTALRGYSDLYASGMLTEEGALDRAMDRIGTETVRLHDLVSDMLELTKGTGPDEHLGLVDLSVVACDVVDDLRSAHPDRVIEFRRPDGSADVLGLSGPLHQAVLNVAANACQHTAPGTSIELAVGVDTDGVHVDVIDHGHGIDPGDIDRVLLPFFRGDASRSRTVGNAGGAGLGLSVAARLVERFGGTIDIGDTPGGGATFTLRFAAASSAEVAAANGSKVRECSEN